MPLTGTMAAPWMPISDAPMDGTPVWVFAFGQERKAFYKDETWNDVVLTGAGPTPRPLMFSPLYWRPDDAEGKT